MRGCDVWDDRALLLLSLLTAMKNVVNPIALVFLRAVKLRGRSSSRRSVDRTKAADDTHLLPVFFARGRSGGLLCSSEAREE